MYEGPGRTSPPRDISSTPPGIIISAGIPIHTSIDNYLRILCKPLFVTSLPILLSLKCTKKWAGTKLRLHQLNKNGNHCLLVYTNVLYVLPTDWELCSRTPDFSRNVRKWPDWIIKVYNLLKSEFCIYWSHQQISQGLASPQGGTPLYGLYRYVLLQRMWFLSRFGQWKKWSLGAMTGP